MRQLCCLVLTALVAGAAPGCSTYGWATDPPEDGSTPAIHVAPPAAPAHLGLDQTGLRSLLVEQLEHRGLAAGSAAAVPSLRCAVTDHATTGFRTDVVAESTVSCDIFPAGADRAAATLEATGLAADRLDRTFDIPGAALRTDRRAGNAAVADAVSRLAPRIVDAVSGLEDDARSTESRTSPEGNR